MPIALSKTLDPATDYPELAPELKIVDQHFTKASPQHEHRRWEYAMALRAFETAFPREGAYYEDVEVVYDVGGAGSPFGAMFLARPHRHDVQFTVIDPAVNCDLATHLAREPRLASAVFCLSVLEHVDDLDQFLYHLSCLVAPGGLLFLTLDCWNEHGPDTAHFHWDRKRIFSIADLKYFAGYGDDDCESLANFSLLGEKDWVYHGHQLFASYTFASLALVKRA